MKALILAAGLGSRLQDETKSKPKCMVEVNGEKLIDRLVKTLIKLEVSPIGVSTGYLADTLSNYLNETFPEVKFEFFNNDMYAQTNNIYSLYQARTFLNDDCLLLESDLIFDEEVLEELVNCPRKDCALVAPFEYWMDGTCVSLNNDLITRFIPKQKLDLSLENYKTVNMYKFSNDYLSNYFIPMLEEKIKENFLNDYYELILEQLTIKNVPLYALVNTKYRWYEIDDAQDLDIASCLFCSAEDKYNRLESREGGYWRFTDIKNLTKPYNPFFPTKQMLNEFEYSLGKLLTSASSSYEILNKLVSKLLRIEESYIAISPNWTERVLNLGNSLKIGVTYSLYQEYNRKNFHQNIKLIETNFNEDMSIDYIIEQTIQLDVIILSNPEDLLGVHYTENDILKLLNYVQDTGKLLIYDESYYLYAEDNFSLINRVNLEKYKNLIIVQSLHKKYGLSGISLDTLITSNQKFTKFFKQPINNSFSEFFLQIIGKYEKEYINTCSQIRIERNNLYHDLKNMRGLNVKPSNSNYIICQLDHPTINSVQKLASELLQNGILINQLDSEYFGIAISSSKENKILVNILDKILD